MKTRTFPPTLPCRAETALVGKSRFYQILRDFRTSLKKRWWRSSVKWQIYVTGKSSRRVTGKSSGRVTGKSSGRVTGKSSGRRTRLECLNRAEPEPTQLIKPHVAGAAGPAIRNFDVAGGTAVRFRPVLVTTADHHMRAVGGIKEHLQNQ